jgi:hypothetical protein
MTASFDKPLGGCRILVAEDDAILAFDLMHTLRNAGAETLGPAMTLKRALILAAEEQLHCGVLDVLLRREFVFPAAQVLRDRHVGIVFYTGHAGTDTLKRDWPEAHILIKPATPHLLLGTVSASALPCARTAAPNQ